MRPRIGLLTAVAFLLLVRPGSAAVSAESPRPGLLHEMPFEIVSNKPWVQVRIRGSEPQRFILDTGASKRSVIARECAERLHLTLDASTPRSLGAGEGVRVNFTAVHDVILELAGDTLDTPALGVFELGHVGPYEGRRLDGLIGHDFMGRRVVELDYARRTLRVYDPEAYRYDGATSPIPITFHEGLAVVPAEVTPPGQAPIPCQVAIDTGVRTTVIWYRPFVQSRNLLSALPRVITGTIGGGAGGESKGDIGRVDSLRIGDLLVLNPTAVFSRDTAGVFSTTGEDGIVGGEILRRCKVTFDYPHQRLMLEPYRTPVEDFDYDMSGIFLVASGPGLDHITIQSVAPGTPADAAGLAKGDEVVSLNGRPAARLTLDQVRDLLKQEGARVRLTVKRGGRARAVTFTLRRLV